MAEEPEWAPLDAVAAPASGPSGAPAVEAPAAAASPPLPPGSSAAGSAARPAASPSLRIAGAFVRPGPLPLRPMTIPDVLDGAFALLKLNARPLLLLAALFIVPVQVLGAFLQRDFLGGSGLLELFRDPSSAQALVDQGGGASGASFLLATASRALMVPALAGAMSVVAARSYLGQEVSFGAAVRVGVRRWWSLVAAWGLVHVVEVVAFPFMFLPSLLVMALFTPVAPVIAIEGVGAIRAMRRSGRLVGPRLFPVLGVALASGVLASAVGVALGVVPQALAYAIGLRRGWVLLAAGSTLTALVTTPLIVLVATLVYFDCRIRQEGLDLEVLAESLAGAGDER